jgi:hypothetical protein
MLTFVLFGAGEDVRDVLWEEGLLFDLKSEISEPAAEGGGLGVGATMPEGWGSSVKALLAVEVEEGGVRLVM